MLFYGSRLVKFLLSLAVLLVLTQAAPVYYKKVDSQKYEPDWVAVSSTVIPLAEYRVSVGAGEGPNGKSSAALVPDEYRRAYLRHKKLTAANKLKLQTDKYGAKVAAQVQEDPDTLITAHKIFYEKKQTGH
ncbi:uncharacterized protein LOC129718252 [Wyeomyia smithii]|uniref:uncharacterized protein LOC129718252 n=1 Tax=Wyeomyia smithii TaxID=174621 RepID=UPI002467C99F|nr:uncharacterized protein LOC129718252 [Wyeomyia smithii]XP_055524812.1 uncharacterized protein LOC129718252 [Wyeomyia smithii]XP_055524813.1 uncharacterized protein LOC129718252 [Wyeomyia smithii]